MAKKKRPATQSSAFIGSVGLLANSLIPLVGYLASWPEELYILVAPITGYALAVWKSGVGLKVDK